MGNSQSSAAGAPASEKKDKDDFMNDEESGGPLIATEKQTENFDVERRLLTAILGQSESRLRVRQGRELVANERFQTLLHSPERFTTQTDSMNALIKSEIRFIDPGAASLEQSSTDDASSEYITNNGEKAAATTSEPVAAVDVPPQVEIPQHLEARIAIAIPPPIKVAQKEFDFSQEAEHVPLRERLRLKKIEDIKRKREREEALGAFAKLNNAPADAPVVKVIEVEPAATTAAAVVEEAIVVAQIEEVKPAVDATLPVAPNESPAVLAAPEQSDKPAEGNEQLPAVESALPAKEEPTPFQPKPMKLKLTVPSLALTHEQSQRYDQIATSAKSNLWALTQKHLEQLATLEQRLDSNSQQLKKIPSLSKFQWACDAPEAALVQCFEKTKGMTDNELIRKTCFDARQAYLKCARGVKDE